MVHCRGCGKQIHETAVSCPHCGAPQGVPTGGGAASIAAPLPEGIKGWSWGAFLFNWIWAAFNGVWIGLIALIPFVGIVMAFVLGFKGREWAWRAKQWDSVEHFQRVQRAWSLWSLVFVIVPILLGILAAVAIPAYQDYVARAKAAQLEVQQHEPEANNANADEAIETPADQDADKGTSPQAVEQPLQTDVNEAMVEETPATENELATTAPEKAESELLAAARSCKETVACITLMLEGALPRRANVVQAAALSIGNLPRPEQGDRRSARELNNRALEQIRNGDYVAAATMLQQAANADPSDVEIKSNLGQALLRSGSHNEAAVALMGALELDPRRSAAWLPLAEALDARNSSGAALRALLLAYDFSANKQRTLAYYKGRSESAEAPDGQRRLFAQALNVVEAGY